MSHKLNENTADLLERIKERLEADTLQEDQDLQEMEMEKDGDGEPNPGELGADNYSDVEEAFTMYMDTIHERLIRELDMGDDDAAEYIFMIADQMAKEDMLPVMPSDEADAMEVAEWLGVAKTSGFEHYVMKTAYKAAME